MAENRGFFKFWERFWHPLRGGTWCQKRHRTVTVTVISALNMWFGGACDMIWAGH